MLLAQMADARSLETLRAQVREIGERSGLTDLALVKFVLVVHELAVNAVRHGGGVAEVRIWSDANGLCCEVTDQGHGIPTQYVSAGRRTSDTEIGGWGLFLVRQICPGAQVVTGRAGTRVTIHYPVPEHG
jgi:anti-sigma regulatory factor (Ser/Thr protein kinase)